MRDFTVITFQDWVGWGIFTVISGYPRRTNGDSQHLEARPELQDWLRSELFTVKNSRIWPFFQNNYVIISNSTVLLGVPSFKPGCLQFLRGSALLRSFAAFCGLLHSSEDLRLLSFALFGAHLSVSASDSV